MINIAYSQCPTGTPYTLTCGSPLNIGPNALSGQWGAISQSAPACAGNSYSYSDIIQTTYVPGQSLSLDHSWANVQNANIFIEVLDGSVAGCPSVLCTEQENSGVGGISATSFVQNPNTGYNNSLLSVNVSLDNLGFTPGQTVYIKIATDKKTSGGNNPDVSATSVNQNYTLDCVIMPENSCENAAPMVGGSSYIVDNQYASDNFNALDQEDGACGYSIENNVMFQWCTDEFNTEVDVIFNSLTINEPSNGAVQFAILSGACNGPYTTIQCNSGITGPTTIPINNANTTANTCYWIMLDGLSGTWWTAEMELQDANPVILPVEMADFYVIQKDNSNNLHWSTFTEQNNSHFIIDRSTDGKTWEFVDQLNGKGNARTLSTYKTKDIYFAKDQINYYRLNQVDFDGTERTYRVVSVDNRIDASNLVRIVNSYGQEVDRDFKGIVFHIYSNGEVIKHFQY